MKVLRGRATCIASVASDEFGGWVECLCPGSSMRSGGRGVQGSSRNERDRILVVSGTEPLNEQVKDELWI